MTIFEEIAKTKEKIEKTRDKLWFLQIQAYSPRSSTISDMPKGGGNVSNPLEQYLEKKEELTEKLRVLNSKVDRLWKNALHQMDSVNIDEQVKKMMYLRFIKGLQWEKCASTLDEMYPNCKWNVNKCFRKYRDVLCKMKKSV